jgi:hypothetical protein
MIDFGKPVKVFLGNLYFLGVKVRVVDGQLRITGDTAKLSPAYREEIVRRSEQLIDLLSPAVPEELRPYFSRLISVDEVVDAMGIAERIDAHLLTSPVNGGWLCVMGKGPRPTVQERKARRTTRKDGGK